MFVSHLRSRERDVVSPRFFHQRKELLLASCTNCLTSSLLECKVVNAPFAFAPVYTCDVRNNALSRSNGERDVVSPPFSSFASIKSLDLL